MRSHMNYYKRYLCNDFVELWKVLGQLKSFNWVVGNCTNSDACTLPRSNEPFYLDLGKFFTFKKLASEILKKDLSLIMQH